MRPDANAPREAFELWNSRYTADLCAKLGFLPAAEPAATVPLPGDERAQGEPAAAPVQAAPDPEPLKAPEPPAPPTAEDAAHLPYPFNLMTPDAVPEYVWKQAREAKAKVKTNPN